MINLKKCFLIIVILLSFVHTGFAAYTITNPEAAFPVHGKYVVFDLETTGLSPSKNEIIEIGALLVDEDGRIINTYSKLVKPVKDISPFITKLTGISNEMVKDADSIEKLLPEFMDFVGDRVVVGHNVRFDIAFVQNKYKALFGKDFVNSYIDTQVIAKNMYPSLESYKLQDLRKRFGIEPNAAHRALDDCIITKKLYDRFCDSYMMNKEE